MATLRARCLLHPREQKDIANVGCLYTTLFLILGSVGRAVNVSDSQRKGQIHNRDLAIEIISFTT